MFCANHESYLDILLLLYSLPPALRKTTFTVGKFTHLRSPILAPFVTKAFIPAGRGADILKTIALSLAVLKKGDNLIIFPEGTRARTGRMNPFKPGVGLLIRESGAAVIPVKIKGTYAIWPAGKAPNFFCGWRVRPSITFGKRFSLNDLVAGGLLAAGSTDEHIAQCIRAVIENM